DVAAGVDVIRPVDRVGVGAGGHVRPVKQPDGRLRPVANECISPAGIEPVDRAAQVVAQGAEWGRGRTVDGVGATVGEGPGRVEHDLVNFTVPGAVVPDDVVQRIRVNRVEPAVGGVIAERDVVLVHASGCDIDHLPAIPAPGLAAV